MSRTRRWLPVACIAGLSWPAVTQAQDAKLADLDAFATAIAAAEPMLSFSVAVVRDDSVVHLAAYGPSKFGGPRATPQTAYYIASSTKSFTALAAALLAERGIVDLDAPIHRYLPEFSLPAPMDRNRITLRRLLSHRGGFESGAVAYRTAYVGNVSQDSLISLLARTAGPVDSSFTYTNTAYLVAARVLERVTKLSWQELLAREIFLPLRLSQTSASPSRLRNVDVAVGFGPGLNGFAPLAVKADALMHPAGGLIMSAADASKWLRAQIGMGRVGDRQVFPAVAIQNTRQQLAFQNDRFEGINRFGYALGWQLGTWEGDTLYHHFGNYPGSFAHISFIPSQRVGVAVFANTEMPALGSLTTVVAQKAYDAALGRRQRDASYQRYADSLPARVAGMRSIFDADARRRAARPRVPPRGWSAYAGEFAANDLGRLTITAIGDSAAEIRYGVARSRLEVLNGDTLRLELPAGRSARPMLVSFDSAGVADRVRFGSAEFVRVRSAR